MHTVIVDFETRSRADLRKCGEQPFAVEIDQMRLPVDQGSGAKRLAAQIGKRDTSNLRRRSVSGNSS